MAIMHTSKTEPVKPEVVTCVDIEVAVAKHFDYRRHLIVPNVFWGLGFNHELDIAVMTQSLYLTEVEIKTSASDLRRDFKKSHAHASSRIRRHFFAVPEKLKDITLELAPMNWGVISVSGGYADQVRPAEINKTARPLTEDEAQHLLRLASMRVWTLKETLCQRIRREKINQ